MVSVEYPETGHEWCAAVEDQSFWFAHRNRVLVELMRRFPPATPLYDVGGGNGAVAVALRNAGMEAVVVEPGASGAQRARLRGLAVVESTLDSAGFKPDTLPSIGLFDVLEHIEAPREFLSAARELLVPGGRIYLTVPAYDVLWSAEDDFAHHFRRYTARSLRDALQAAGFEVEHSTYFFFFLLVPILLFRSLPFRVGYVRSINLDKVQGEHSASGIAGSVLRILLRIEMRISRARGGLPFGASVLAVARKPSAPFAAGRLNAAETSRAGGSTE